MHEAVITPALNQVELHPGLTQKAVRAANSAAGIATEAWSPLARGRFNDNELLTDIAAKYGKSVSQVIIRWHIDLGNLVIPKTSNPDRLIENFNVFDFKLSAEDMRAIEVLDTGMRTGAHPDELN
jgi:diketogulonate reductase-like aldo/keto reductase